MERTDLEQWRAKEVARLLALVEAERRYYQEIVAGLPTPVAVVSAENYVSYANRSFRRRFQVRSEDLRRKTLSQILPVEGLEGRVQHLHQHGPSEPFVAVLRDQSFRITLLPMRGWDDDSDLETLLTAEDVSLPPVEVPFAAPVSSVPSVSSIPADVPAVIWQANPSTLVYQGVWGDVEALLGYPPEHWTTTSAFFEDRIALEDRATTLALYRAVIATGGEASAEFRSAKADGSAVWCRETIRIPEPGVEGRVVTGLVTNISIRKGLEHQLITAGRQEALHGLAGQLAHDLNNSVMIASGYGEELLQTVEPNTSAHGDISEMVEATKRISDLAGQLTDYERPHAKERAPLELNALVDSLSADLVRIAGAGTTVEITVAPDVVWTAVDRQQLSGVILALSAAIREGALERTKVAVSVSAPVLLEYLPGTRAPGQYAMVRVRDDGRGLDAKRCAAQFETVIQAKKQGVSQVALVRAYALVREWGGDISVESTLGGGTTFSVYLPFVAAAPAAAPVVEVPVAEVVPPALPVMPVEMFRETILVVDDEAGIRGLVRKILRRERYQVLEAGSAEDALAIAVSHAGPIHLLLTDVMLPGLKGPELARRMYEASPNLKVLYISGFTGQEIVDGGGEYPPGAKFLAKPFTLGALVTTVREALIS
jgi:two-component system, cell cycle sensor histidine kinase and response regulator CckA